MLGKWYDGEFVQISKVNDTVKRFWVQIPSLKTIDFQAGQFMTFDLPIHEKRHKRWRSYSIASPPNNDNVLEFVIVNLDGGEGTQYLFEEVEIGTPLKLRGPLGIFNFPEAHLKKEICFVCTGTGIAPFRSFLLDLKNKGESFHKIHLIFGTRHEDGILYRQEMEALAKKWKNFHYYITLSRAEDWEGSKGYVHSIYEEVFADNRDAHFYLCGWNEMLDEAKDRLTAMGYERNQITYESYG
ncbi:MAG: FAD-binding oxidoreductase [Chitinophagales bacterium]